MKNRILILLLFIAAKSFGQGTPIDYTPQTAAGYQFKYIKADSGITIAFRDTTTGRGTTRPGSMVVRPQDSLFWGFNGHHWERFGKVGNEIPKVDSVTISSDTLFYWINGTSVGWVLPNGSNWKFTGNYGICDGCFLGTLDAADLVFRVDNTESGRLSNFGRTQFGFLAEAFWREATALGYMSLAKNPSSTAIGPRAEAAADSSTAIGAGASINVNQGIGLGDTTRALVGIRTGFPEYPLDVHGQVRIKDGTEGAGKVLTSDATGATSWTTISGTGTVTNVATGYGLSGGAITTTGTIVIDTATLSGKYLRVSDTTSMLGYYLRKGDTTNKWIRRIENNAGADSIIYWIGSTRYAIKDNGAGGGTYSAGNGLTLSGSTFKADTSIVSTKNNVLYYYDLLNGSKLDRYDSSLFATRAFRDKLKDSLGVVIDLKADKSTTININGVPQDLSANRTWTIVPTDTSVANVMAYGAYGDGTHSDAWAFLLAIASNKPVYVPPGNYKLNDTMLILNDYQKIYGNGFLSTLITSYAGGGAYFGVIRSGKYNTIYNLRFVGTGKVTYPGSTLTEQNAIMLSGNHNDVNSCFFENIGGAAVNMLKPGFDSVWFNNVSYLQIRESTAGIQTLINAQYNTFSNINAQYVNRAVYDGNGNNTWVNINGEDCNEGHVLGPSGGNNNHGTLIASKYNHTNYPFVATGGIDVEYVVSATKFYGGIINLTDCDNLWFQNCSLSTNTINITASSTAKKVHFTDCPHLGPLFGAITWNVTGTAVLDTSLISGFNPGVTIPLDSTNYKLAVIDANGNPRKMFWPTSGSGSSRMAISAHAVGTDANITAAAGTVYHLPAATLSTNRTINVSGLSTAGDFIRILNNEAGFTWSFTGATVYLIDGVTTVTTLLSDAVYDIQLIGTKLTIIN